jgi:hypothetical protein
MFDARADFIKLHSYYISQPTVLQTKFTHQRLHHSPSIYQANEHVTELLQLQAAG